MGTKRSKATEFSPANITVTDRDVLTKTLIENGIDPVGVHSPSNLPTSDQPWSSEEALSAADNQDTVLTLDFLKGVEQKHPGSVFKAANALQNTDSLAQESAIQTEPVGEAFLLDAISKILSRLEALEDLNLEERLAKYNSRAPHKI